MYLKDLEICYEEKLTLDFKSTWLNYAYGCFETLLVRNAKIEDAKLHLSRAKRTLTDFYLFSVSENQISRWEQALNEYCQRLDFSKNQSYRLKIYFFEEQQKLKIVAKAFEYHFTKLEKVKLKLFYNSEDFFAPKLCEHKLINYAAHYVLKQKASKLGFYDYLRVSKDNSILETTTSNIIVQINGERFTPPVGGILPGVVREKLIAENQISERKIYLRDKNLIERIWISNSLFTMLEIDEVEFFYKKTPES